MTTHAVECETAELRNAPFDYTEGCSELEVRVALEVTHFDDQTRTAWKSRAGAADGISELELFDVVARVSDQIGDTPRFFDCAPLIDNRIERYSLKRNDPIHFVTVERKPSLFVFDHPRALVARQMVEASKLVAHLTQDSHESEPPKRAVTAGRLIAVVSAFRIPIACSFGQALERGALEIRYLCPPGPPSVPPRDAKGAVDVLLRQLEHAFE